VAYLACRICSVSSQARTYENTRQVDVYCGWIDECRAVNEEAFGRLNGLPPEEMKELAAD